MNPILMLDLESQQIRIREQLDQAIARVLDHRQFVMGPEIAELETALGRRMGAEAVACGSGTDALIVALLSLGLARGDSVIVPSFTFAATAEAVALCGGQIIFADIRADTFNIDPAQLESTILETMATGDRIVGIVSVDMFGQPAEQDAIRSVADQFGIWVVADAAQSFGAMWDGLPTGALADVTTTSFFPSKPLSCYGDGGAVFARDPALADVCRSVRNHGQSDERYDHVRLGLNGRMDTLQAAIVIEKLAIFDDELRVRRELAGRYDELLEGTVTTPTVLPAARPTWAQYAIKSVDRELLSKRLAEVGVATAVHYPRPLHFQAAFSGATQSPSGLTISEQVAGEVLSIPMHPYLSVDDQVRIASAIRDASVGA